MTLDRRAQEDPRVWTGRLFCVADKHASPPRQSIPQPGPEAAAAVRRGEWRRAVGLARTGLHPVATIVAGLAISESCLHGPMP